PGKFKGEDARLEPAITRAESRIQDVRRQVGKALSGLRAVQQVDVRQPPATLRGAQLGLGARAFRCPRHEEVALVPKPNIDTRLKVVEECHALTDHLDLLDVV